MKKILMIALNGSLLSSLDIAKYEVYILEEKEIYDARPERYDYPIIKEIKFGSYQQSNDFLNTAIEWNKQIEFNAVVSGSEYAVNATNTLANKLHLLGSGEKAVNTFTNKIKLREYSRLLSIPQPNFKKVHKVLDIYSFFKNQPIIIKPANRRSSEGVIKINDIDDIDIAWDECTSVDEGYRTVKYRNLTWEYLVEEYMEGEEVSIETLVHNYKPIFHNITSKKTTSGPHFVELSHTVPGFIQGSDKEKLICYKEKILNNLNSKSGLFHSEWKITNNGPKIIECAARAPGDYIPKLISTAYGFNLYEAYIQVLMGVEPDINIFNNKVVRVEYFDPPKGKIVEIKGLDFLESTPEVIDYQVNKQPGDLIEPLISSKDRIGQYIILSDSHEKLTNISDEIKKKVKFVVR
ncbi:ATP-grasp domain-containing protein [Oceanobacillus oncorhynchi]|uniref:ATP-grasp domain-containing protein n=1 Tax=Oceanobacillus oncorhynchi TaxID=545501 RepID=UPI001867E40F|nr:ATP-grasp domain-containing protein [Oceanobacillus oncorhynchi]